VTTTVVVVISNIMKYIESMHEVPGLFFRRSLLAGGHTRGYIDHAVASGRWVRLHEGIYVETASTNFDSAVLHAHLAACSGYQEKKNGESLFKQANLQYGLPVLSHYSAARLHQFDSTRPMPTTTTITSFRNCGVRIHRDASLVIVHPRREVSTEIVDGLPVTSRARTLLDLAAIVSDEEAERILESALRGPDPKRPHIWREEVLSELLVLLESHPRHRGTNTVRRILNLRAHVEVRPSGELVSPKGRAHVEVRPTGSLPETVLVQLLRGRAIKAIRQPRVVVNDDRGRRFEYYPDLLITAGRCIVEVDGASHRTPQRARTDAARQNRLLGFHIFRYPADQIMTEPEYVVSEISTHVRRTRNTAPNWTSAGVCVSGQLHEWSITPQRFASSGGR
jgi:very-short-patch-repair endonuclease